MRNKNLSHFYLNDDDDDYSIYSSQQKKNKTKGVENKL